MKGGGDAVGQNRLQLQAPGSNNLLNYCWSLFWDAHQFSLDTSECPCDSVVLQWYAGACILAIVRTLLVIEVLCTSAFEQFTRMSRKRSRTCLDINPITDASDVAKTYLCRLIRTVVCLSPQNNTHPSISCLQPFSWFCIGGASLLAIRKSLISPKRHSSNRAS